MASRPIQRAERESLSASSAANVDARSSIAKLAFHIARSAQDTAFITCGRLSSARARMRSRYRSTDACEMLSSCTAIGNGRKGGTPKIQTLVDRPSLNQQVYIGTGSRQRSTDMVAQIPGMYVAKQSRSQFSISDRFIRVFSAIKTANSLASWKSLSQSSTASL
jgi:hypothetical protein